jgi:hypothetical protein
VLLSEEVWKQTAISDFVIKRFCRLYKDRIVTFRKADDYSDHKWARPGEGLCACMLCACQPPAWIAVGKAAEPPPPPP